MWVSCFGSNSDLEGCSLGIINYGMISTLLLRKTFTNDIFSDGVISQHGIGTKILKAHRSLVAFAMILLSSSSYAIPQTSLRSDPHSKYLLLKLGEDDPLRFFQFVGHWRTFIFHILIHFSLSCERAPPAG